MTKPVPGVVACLAPGKPAHSFYSPDRARVRFCPRCRPKLPRSVPPILLYPVVAPPG